MIFGERLLNAVLAGEKTVTRRVSNGAPCKYLPGRTYALQPARGRPGIGRIQVVSVRQECLGALTSADARAEGFAGRDEFFAYWRRLYRRVDPDLVVNRIEFRLVFDGYTCPGCGTPTVPADQAHGRPPLCAGCKAAA